MRLFFAVHAGESIAGQVSRIIEYSSIRRAPWRWIRPENYHFTLKFLGEVDGKMLPSIHDAARRAAAGTEPFRLTMGSIGGFPDLERPRVIYYAINGGFTELRDLAGRIEDECEKIGFEREKKRFRAHLTLARVKSPVDDEVIGALRNFPPLDGSAVLDAGHFTLMSSRLTPSGALYEEAGRFELGS
jgi:2'-5' RNA ligase